MVPISESQFLLVLFECLSVPLCMSPCVSMHVYTFLLLLITFFGGWVLLFIVVCFILVYLNFYLTIFLKRDKGSIEGGNSRKDLRDDGEETIIRMLCMKTTLF